MSQSKEVSTYAQSMSGCLMCTKHTKKYKCSKCLEWCCSYDCYKEHNEHDLCLPQVADVTAPNTDLAETSEPTQHVFKTYDMVPPEQLAKLQFAEGVKNTLYNPHLRKLLKELDTDAKPWRAMQNAMQEPLFIEFADECLKVIEPDELLDN